MQNHTIYTERLEMIRPEKNVLKSALCCCFFPRSGDYLQFVECLHPQERDYLNTLRFEVRTRNYLAGRFAAKQAIATLTGEKNLSSFFIAPGVFAQPVVSNTRQNVQVSITHCGEFAGALAFPEQHPMGIDIEKIHFDNRAVLEEQITESEKEEILLWPFPRETSLALLWTAKEALSKVLKTGLMTPFSVYEISHAELHDDHAMCCFKNFAQYKAVAFTVNDYACSIVCPLKTQMCFPIHSLREKFAC